MVVFQLEWVRGQVRLAGEEAAAETAQQLKDLHESQAELEVMKAAVVADAKRMGSMEAQETFLQMEVERLTAELGHERKLWQASAAQTAKELERLQAEVARLEMEALALAAADVVQTAQEETLTAREETLAGLTAACAEANRLLPDTVQLERELEDARQSVVEAKKAATKVPLVEVEVDQVEQLQRQLEEGKTEQGHCGWRWS